eukprot:scaffold1367_cov104-Isochrysis_galbana.AAC.3
MRAAGAAELRAKKTKMIKRRLQMPTLRSRPSPPKRRERPVSQKKQADRHGARLLGKHGLIPYKFTWADVTHGTINTFNEITDEVRVCGGARTWRVPELIPSAERVNYISLQLLIENSLTLLVGAHSLCNVVTEHLVWGKRAERNKQPAKKAAKQAEKAEVPGRTGGACGGKKRKGARQRLAGSQWKQGAPRPEDEDPHVQEGADRGAPLTEVPSQPTHDGGPADNIC